MPLARRELLVLGGVGAAAAVAGGLIGALTLQSRSGAAELLGSTFADAAGKPRRLLEWQGRVLVCNFWATWCAPCREEMPMLSAAQQHYESRGITVVGIGIDQADKIVQFTVKEKISYVILVAGQGTIDLMRQLGNPGGGLPFTVILDRSGALAFRRLGPLTRPELDGALAGLLP
jgi:thiol-disulfide isomerase/thioredoxin